MIGKIIGLIEEKTTHNVLVNVNGLCYEIDIPLTTAFSLPDIGSSVSLYIHFVVREDAQLLYGFLNKKDRDMFRVLIKVNGVGPKLGITILSGLDSAALARCVIHDEVSTLVKLPGIGKKTAERLLIELRDKVKNLDVEHATTESQQSTIAFSASVQDEAESALVALGYKPQDAAKVVKKAAVDNQTLEELIKAALKSMI
jgi:Holliday junction DNA helicase RuvA